MVGASADRPATFLVNAATERVAAATGDAAQAVDLLRTAGDRWRRGQARQLLRTLRADHPAAVDEAWAAWSDALPVWLRLPTIDTAAGQLLIDWVGTESWPESFDFLADHAPSLLTDRAEASLEHLIDHNPGNTNLDQHLDILRAARKHGLELVRTEFLDQMAVERLAAHLGQWINTSDWAASAEYLTAHAEELLARNVVELPALLRYLGLLGLARQLGVEEAHALVTDRAARDSALTARPPTERLALCRCGRCPRHGRRPWSPPDLPANVRDGAHSTAPVER